MYKLGLVGKLRKKNKEVVKHNLPKLKILRRSILRSVQLRQNSIKSILDEIRHQEFFNHINYKAIGSVLSEI